jgi:hypothetical protein
VIYDLDGPFYSSRSIQNGEVFEQLVGIGAELVAERRDRLWVALGILESFDRREGRAATRSIKHPDSDRQTQ